LKVAETDVLKEVMALEQRVSELARLCSDLARQQYFASLATELRALAAPEETTATAPEETVAR
jgi:hypothetical protein